MGGRGREDRGILLFHFLHPLHIATAHCLVSSHLAGPSFSVAFSRSTPPTCVLNSPQRCILGLSSHHCISVFLSIVNLSILQAFKTACTLMDAEVTCLEYPYLLVLDS